MPRRDDHNAKTSSHPDGKKENIIKDPTGVQIGVETGKTHKLNPSFIDPERVLEESKGKKDQKEKSPPTPWVD